MVHKRIHLNSFQAILIGFALFIVLGSLLLLLPVSTKSRQVTPYNQCLFTAVSAMCVTGLVVVDTAAHWSVFGQVIILLMIQIGGLGVITAMASLMLLFDRKLSLMQKITMQEAVSAPKVGGVVRLTVFVLVTSLVIEAVGAIAMLPTFIINFGARGIWMAIFHSVSAFCNAGFDIMGTAETQFVSLTAFAGNVPVNITVMLLIMVGGIGFLTLDDIKTNKWHVKRYGLQTKVVLITTAILIVVPFVYFFFAEFSSLPLGRRILVSLFQSVTPRTAGFNTVDLNSLSGSGRTLTIILMLIGGSPGSTAGGIKTTTFALIFANALSVFGNRKDTHMLRRNVDDQTVKRANALLLMYLMLFVVGACVISLAEGLPMDACLFETASAIGTVGLTLGITTQLGILSQIVLMLLMFVGRVGGLTILYAALSASRKDLTKYPQEKIAIG